MLTSISKPYVDAWRIRVKGDAQEARNFIHQFMESPEGLVFQQNPDGAPGIFVYDPRKPLEGLQAFGYEGAEKLKALYTVNTPEAAGLGCVKSTSSQPHIPAAEIITEPSVTRINVSDTLSDELADEPFTEGDIFIVQARENLPLYGGSTALGRFRTAVYKAASSQNLVELDKGHHYLWVNNFPLFTPNNNVDPGQGGSAGFSATHHPFTAPRSAEDVDLLFKNPLLAKADHYDLVVNGVELGGGSRRIHNSEMQQFIMRDVLKVTSIAVILESPKLTCHR